MAASLQNWLCLSDPYGAGSERKERVVLGSPDVLALKNDFRGRHALLREQRVPEEWNHHKGRSQPSLHTSICNPRASRWWESSFAANMMEIGSAQELVDSLLSSGDKLVIVDFYSPGCGGCRALHPKICQLAGSNPSALFLKVNYEELKPMCRSLNIHVLPFFRFYRGAEGRVCSFSCTNATISKFKDALTKHGIERCSLGPAKGLEESELLSLTSNRETGFSYPFGSSRSGDFAFFGTSASIFPGSIAGIAGVEETTAALAVASME